MEPIKVLTNFTILGEIVVLKSQILPVVELLPNSLVLIYTLKAQTVDPAPISQDVFHSQDEDGRVVLSRPCHSFPFPPVSDFVEVLPDVTETRPAQDVCHF